MATKPTTGNSVYDALTAFLGGVNSGINPILLDRDQLAWGTNTTIRGGFVTHRPPYQDLTLDFGGNAALEATFKTGFFTGGSTYRPDFGNQSLVLAINGKLLQAIITGNTAIITDISIPGDPNPALTSQSWLWQSEKWIIWEDGQDLPVFFNGSTSRRSNGDSIQLASVTGLSLAAPPPLGDTVDATVSANYIGTLNAPIQLNGAFYEVSEIVGGDPTNAVLTNLYATTGAIIPVGAELFYMPGRVGKIVSSNRSSASAGIWDEINAVMTSLDNISVGIQVTISILGITSLFSVIAIDTTTKTASFKGVNVSFGNTVTVTNGSVVNLSVNTNPTVSLGTAVSLFLVPALGADVNVQLSLVYSGANGTSAWIGDEQYAIASKAPGGTGTVIRLINLSDTGGTNYTLPLDITSVPELPAGRMGAYGMGRNWLSLIDGVSFMAGNIVGGEGGTQVESYRDSVLKTTENYYLNGGGTFRLPGSGDTITAMLFTANLDASMGQGPLQVFTARSVFSVNAPVDNTTWQDLTFPILSQSLLGSGALSQQSTFQVNSDTFFRGIDGWRTLILARRNFSELWGNTPISREMERVLAQEDHSLLSWVSGIQFDNRALLGAVPQATASGVASTQTVALNFDPVSTMAVKSPPVYDGVWNGLNVLQYFRAVIDNLSRCFAVAYDSVAKQIKIVELLPTNDTKNRFDNGVTPIEWTFESATLFKQVAGRPLLKLGAGELYVDNLVGTCDFSVFYKTDQYPCWTLWHRWSICAEEASEADPDLKPGYQPRMGFGEPDMRDCDEFTGRPKPIGYNYQFKFTIRGSCRVLGAKFMANVQPEPEFAKPICESS